MVNQTHSWGEYRVYFYDDEGQLCSIPAKWTSLCPVDPYLAVGQGRCFFLLEDLLSLSKLLGDIRDTVK